MGTNCQSIYGSISAAAQHAGQQASNLAQAAGQQAQPIPEPAPELCAFPGCQALDYGRKYVHGPCASGNCACGLRRNLMYCHDFVAPQAKPVLREPKPEDVMPAVCGVCGGGYIDAVAHAAWHARINPCVVIPATVENTRSLRETGPSAVAAAPGIEPWRPTVDDDFWIPNASEGWRR